MFNPKSILVLGLGCGCAIIMLFIGIALFFSAVGHTGLNLGVETDTVGNLTCGDKTTSIVARDSKYIDRINKKLDLYKKAAEETNIPWELLAAIHYRENEFGEGSLISGRKIGVPEPDQGGRIYGSQYETAVSAGKILHGKVSGLSKSTSDSVLIKKVLFAYNGTAGVYKQQAVKLGFNGETQGFEGSPYVMNNFDLIHKNMLIIRRDHGGLEPPPDARDGAYTVFALLKTAQFGSDGKITIWGDCTINNGNISGDGNRLGVEQIQQRGRSNCNDTAVYIAAKFLAIKYNKIEPSTCPMPPPAGDMQGSTLDSFHYYMRHFGFSSGEYSIKYKQSGFPSDNAWKEIKSAVIDKKTPVVIATGFGSTTSNGACGRSGYFTHYIVIEGFSTDGNTVYVADPNPSKNPKDPKHGNSHPINQNGGRGQFGWQGAYCNYMYAIINK